MKITISQELKVKLPNFQVFAYSMDVSVKNTLEVEKMLFELKDEFNNKYDITEVVNIPKLKHSRDGYKKLGKDPSRYRLATEALIRRLVKGMDLYRINDVSELDAIGAEEYFYSNGISLVEWPIRAIEMFPHNAIKVYIEKIDDEKRKIRVER